jgi:hypothetical protein
MSSVMNVSAASDARRTPRAYDMRGILARTGAAKLAKFAKIDTNPPDFFAVFAPFASFAVRDQ